MSLRASALFLSTAAVLTLAGCAASRPEAAFPPVEHLVQERTGQAVHWQRGTAEDREVERAVDQVLRRPLSAADAVHIALLRNRSLQARYEELGIAQADLVQAGVLSNPHLSLSAQFATGPGQTRLDGGLSQDIIDLFLIPLRKKLARAELQQAQVRVADAVLELGHEVEAAYIGLVARQRQVAIQRQESDAAEAALTIARRQRGAGDITELELAAQEADASQRRVALAQTEAELQGDREKLNRLMGLDTPPSRWQVKADLSDLPAEEGGNSDLEKAALEQRLDVRAARGEIGAAETALAVGRRSVVGPISPGAGFERDTDGRWTVGPNVDLQVPIFDRGQGRIPRLQAEVRQAKRREEALETQARSEVRLAATQVAAARQAATVYRETLVPQQERLYQETVLQFNAMTANLQDLLQARLNQLTAQQEYVRALAEYWTARSALARAMGGSVALAQAAATQPTASAEAANHHH